MREFYLIYYTTKNDTQLSSIIRGMGAYFNFEKGCWIISSKLSIDSINQRIIPYFDKRKERLLILNIKIEEAKGWHKKEVWDWIRQQRLVN